MNLLLDTHVVIWCAADPGRLKPEVTARFLEAAETLWYSPISVWETMVLAEKGRITLGPDIPASTRDIFDRLPLREATLNTAVAIRSRQLSLSHADPADRFIAATALVYGFTLVTADQRLLEAADIQVMAAA